MKVLVSACLLGVCCRYDGRVRNMPEEWTKKLLDNHTVIPVCPEQLGGLPTPREDTQRLGDEVVGTDGRSFSKEYYAGAEETVRLARLLGCEAAVLADRSPSCGCRNIHDGTFSGVVIKGEGVAAQMLRESGIKTYSESEIEEL